MQQSLEFMLSSTCYSREDRMAMRRHMRAQVIEVMYVAEWEMGLHAWVMDLVRYWPIEMARVKEWYSCLSSSKQ